MKAQPWHYHLYALVADIPPGCTRSYGDLAGEIPEASARTVARVLSQLPGDTALPWHRVIRSDGRIADHPGRHEQQQRLAREGHRLSAGKAVRTSGDTRF